MSTVRILTFESRTLKEKDETYDQHILTQTSIARLVWGFFVTFCLFCCWLGLLVGFCIGFGVFLAEGYLESRQSFLFQGYWKPRVGKSPEFNWSQATDSVWTILNIRHFLVNVFKTKLIIKEMQTLQKSKQNPCFHRRWTKKIVNAIKRN